MQIHANLMLNIGMKKSEKSKKFTCLRGSEGHARILRNGSAREL